MEFVFYFVNIFQQILLVLIFIRVILSWFGVKISFISDATEWILGPLRMLVPPLGGVMDVSPLLAFFLIQYVGDGILWLISNQI